jgi:hypothetical protein
LLEAGPNIPLPWKGVLLVLIPGLIFFISQIVQLTSTKDWFFIVFYRAGYFLILPVLLVWMLTRRFPIWGLIPFGLLYKLLGQYSPRYLISKLPFFRPMHTLARDPLGPFSTIVDLNYLVPIATCAVFLSAFIWYNARHQQIPQRVWKWLGCYGLLIVFQIILEVSRMITWEAAWQSLDWQSAVNSTEVKQYMIQMPFWLLYEPLLFLLLVFVGKLFARKYGGLSFLLLLGYLLPTIIFGRYDTTQHTAISFFVVSLAVLIYRLVVALVAPVWLVRAASIAKRQRAAAIPIAIAIITHISLNLIGVLTMANQNSIQLGPLDLVLTIWSQLIIAAGLGLAVALYLPKNGPVTPPPALVAIAE